MNSSTQQKINPEELLNQLEEEQKQFQNHWVWKELNCSPRDFFSAVEKHVKEMNVPPEKWKATYEKVKRANYVRAMEQKQSARPVNFKMLAAIRV